MESIVRDKIIQIEKKAARYISNLRQEENKSKALIRDEERLLLEMISKNPYKWTSKTLKFNITSSEANTEPNVAVEILRSISELKKLDQIQPFGWQTVGRVHSNDYFVGTLKTHILRMFQTILI